MKKTILTALLAVFVMVGFANNETSELKNDDSKNKTEVDSTDKAEVELTSKTEVSSTNNADDPCTYQTLTCGLSGWFCGGNYQSMWAGVAMAEKIHCTFEPLPQ